MQLVTHHNIGWIMFRIQTIDTKTNDIYKKNLLFSPMAIENWELCENPLTYEAKKRISAHISRPRTNFSNNKKKQNKL